MKGKEGSEKAGLKLNIQKTEIIASGPITSCQIDGETMETVTDFIKSLQMITEAMKLKDACPLEKSYDKLRQHIKKQRHFFADKSLYSQSYGFSSSHFGWELDHKEVWVPENRCFWTVCWRRLLRVPWTARRSNQSILKEINPEYSLEGLMLKLKLQYFGHMMWNGLMVSWLIRKDSEKRAWERLKAGEEGYNREQDGWLASLTQCT